MLNTDITAEQKHRALLRRGQSIESASCAGTRLGLVRYERLPGFKRLISDPQDCFLVADNTEVGTVDDRRPFVVTGWRPTRRAWLRRRTKGWVSRHAEISHHVAQEAAGS